MLESRYLLSASVLTGLWFAELTFPFFIEQRRDLRRLLRHDFRNLLLGGVNAVISAVAFAGLLVAIDRVATGHGFGVLRWLDMPAWLEWPVALLLFDLWMYAWHRLNHSAPFLWRFHRMHHSDPAMDVTSGVRFHPGEIALSGSARLAIVPLLGMSIEQLVVYESILLPVVLFHHSNVRLPKWIDFGTMALLVTPAMHRVHHSQLREETNSNYGSVLPWWDFLFGSLRVRRDSENIEFGLPEFNDEQSQTLAGMLTTPLNAQKKTDDS